VKQFFIRLCIAAVGSAAATTQVQAQAWPTKPIRILVGFPAGGPSDVPARIIGQHLQPVIGQPVVVENKTGAAGMIALNEMRIRPRTPSRILSRSQNQSPARSITARSGRAR